jgi:hypothetical protein
MTARKIFLACLLLFVSEPLVAEDADARRAIGFNARIRPLLTEYCFACHGPDSASRKADLRLDLPESAMESGVIVPGSAADSELIVRINSTDADLVMPPPDSHKSLEPAHKALLAEWIESGAEWESHWSFIPPERANLPTTEGVDAWASNEIDHFVFDKVHQLGFEPNGPADRHTLARRVALDLTGLPPSAELLDEFVADTNEDSYDRYVDALLSSQYAGEHRARYWLDAARYGDTHGMHVDNYREIWPYRDWVVRAFNTGMPFDQFVVEQIAGDLLPDATLDQRIATGFNRCNITTSEGGAIPDEVNVRYMIDRVETTSTVFLGLTTGCAVCHDHKYDPISQREFYRLGAFFNNTTQPPMDGNQKDTPPVVALPEAKFQEEWASLRTRRRQLRNELGAWSSSAKSASASSASAESTSAESAWASRSRKVDHPVAADELLLSLPLTEGEGEPVVLPEAAAWASAHPAGRRGVRFGNGDALTANLPALRSDEPLTVSFWFRTPDRLMETNLFDHASTNDDKKQVGWKITGTAQGGLSFEMHDGGGQKISGHLPGEEALRPRSWQHVCVRYSGGQSNSSINILVDGRTGVLRNSTEAYVDGAEMPGVPLKIASNLPSAGLSDIRVFRRWLNDDEVQLLAGDYTVKRLIQTDQPWEKLGPDERRLMTRFHNVAVDDSYRSRLRELADLERRHNFIFSRSTTTMVMEERQTRPRAWVLERGQYDQRRDEVAPGIPNILTLPPSAKSASEGSSSTLSRLDLARWLVHPQHPLTARVMVNRLWQSVFGTGLIKTSEDFGVMGDRPSHPELLDWLAVEFVESGWDVNHILKLIVTSSAYRQDSRVTPEVLAQDPDNRYLARGPRVRLDAEVLRDQILAVSGLLRRDLGGPAVKPYQPAGLWQVVAIGGSNTRVYERDSGDALYRRSLYTFWKRTSPPPSMAAFNAPTREQCTVRRERTNTPIQALVLMNDPQYVEAARHVAAQALHQHEDPAARAALMLETVLSRPARDIDVAEMTAVADQLRAIFEKEPDAAKGLIHTGDSAPDESLDVIELATWTMVANTIMNRDDFINN